METLDDFKTLCQAFAEQVGLPQLDLDREPSFALSLNQLDINIGYQEQTNTVFIVLFLNHLPTESAEAACRDLLRENFNLPRNLAGAFALVPDENQISYVVKTPLSGLSVPSFYRLLQDAIGVGQKHLTEQEKSMHTAEIAPLSTHLMA